MSKQEPTQQQLDIMNAISTNVAVSAGAGSGKTQVLVTRYINILKQSLAQGPDVNNNYSLYVDQIVAITFTKKAAAEMRTRLRQQLNAELGYIQEAYAKGDVDGLLCRVQANFWRQQLERLPRTHISTIHGLCSFLLRENPREANLDPQFTVAEEHDGESLVQNCLQEYIRQSLRKQEPHITALINQYGLEGFLAQIDLLLPELDTIEACGDLQEPYKAIIASIDDNKKQLCALLTELAENREDYKKPKTYAPNLELLWVQLEEVMDEVRQEPADFSHLREIFGKMQARDDFKIIYGGIKNLMATIEAKSYEHLALPIVEHWQAILQGLNTYVQAKKLEQDLLTYDDLEQMAIALLKNYPEIRQHYHQRFAHIMVDEFQDTNNRQRQLIYLLCGNDEDRLSGNKLFVVGDPKQSIYRFRGADVAVFKRVQEEIKAGKGKCLSMDKNFRSQESILDTVNGVFAPLMGVDKSQEVFFSPLAADVPRLEGGEKPKLYTYCYPKGLSNDKYAREAELVVAKILELRAQGIPLKDITILLRYMTRCDVLLPALQKYRVPYVVTSGRGFYEQQEVLDLLNLLTAVNNKYRGLELVGVLRSPYFGLDDETISELVLALDEAKAQEKAEHAAECELAGIEQQAYIGSACLWDVLQSYEITLLKQEQQQLLERARSILKELRSFASSCSLMELWSLLWDKLKVPAVLSQQKLGEAKLANAEKLRTLAQNFVDQQQGSLTAWLEYVQSLRADGVQETSATVESKDAVQIMTYHASKGLQFSVVLLPFMEGVEMVDRDDLLFLPPNRFHANVPWGLGVKILVDGQLKNTYLLEQLRQEERRCSYEERKRLLYVAVTRAEKQLYFFASAEEGKKYATADWEQKNWYVQLRSLVQDEAVLAEGDAEALLAHLQTFADDKKDAMDVSSPMLQPLASYNQLGQLYFSPSALQSYAHCPRYYFYHYGMKLPGSEPEKVVVAEQQSELSPSVIGLIVHSTLEYYSLPHYDEDELQRCFAMALKEHVKGRTSGTEPAKAMLVQYLQSKLLPPLDKAEKEKEIKFYLGTLQVNGFIDCMYPNADGTWTIVDYKTGRVPHAAQEKNTGYMYQLALYRLAVETLFKREVSKCALHYLQELEPVELADDVEYQKYLSEALAHCKEIGSLPKEESAFPCMVGKQCEYCEYAYMCNGIK